MDKMRHVADQVRMIRSTSVRAANFVLWLDAERGPILRVTKRFLDITRRRSIHLVLSPSGAARPQSEYHREGRVLGFPSTADQRDYQRRRRTTVAAFLRPRDRPPEPRFLSHDASRFRATETVLLRALGVLRAVSTEGFGRIKYYR